MGEKRGGGGGRGRMQIGEYAWMKKEKGQDSKNRGAGAAGFLVK